MYEYAPELIIGTLGTSILFFTIVWASKYLGFPEVHTLDRGERISNYIGRKMRYKKKPSSDKIKGKMRIMKCGWLCTKKITVTIPEDVKVNKKSRIQLIIHTRNIRYDYQEFQSYRPTNKEFKAIHPSESLFNDEITEKVTQTNKEVRKATNANPEVSKWQKTSGSIPLTAEGEKGMEIAEKNLEEIGSFDQFNEEDEEQEEEDKKKSYSKAKARKELEKKIGGDE